LIFILQQLHNVRKQICFPGFKYYHNPKHSGPHTAGRQGGGNCPLEKTIFTIVINYSSDIWDFFRHIDLTAPWWKNTAYGPVDILGHAYRNLSFLGGRRRERGDMFLIYTKNLFALVWFSLNMQHLAPWFSVKYHNYLSNTILSCFTILYIKIEMGQKLHGTCYFRRVSRHVESNQLWSKTL
jgi:hypothetical protein